MICPELKVIHSGDESWYYCLLTERPSGRIQGCPREYGGGCAEYDKIMKELSVCPECGEERPDDERVQNGMKCGICAGYGLGNLLISMANIPERIKEIGEEK